MLIKGTKYSPDIKKIAQSKPGIDGLLRSTIDLLSTGSIFLYFVDLLLVLGDDTNELFGVIEE